MVAENLVAPGVPIARTETIVDTIIFPSFFLLIYSGCIDIKSDAA